MKKNIYSRNSRNLEFIKIIPRYFEFFSLIHNCSNILRSKAVAIKYLKLFFIVFGKVISFELIDC